MYAENHEVAPVQAVIVTSGFLPRDSFRHRAEMRAALLIRGFDGITTACSQRVSSASMSRGNYDDSSTAAFESS